MKVTYEFEITPDCTESDFMDLMIVQKAQDMYAALHALEQYLRQVKDGHIKDGKDQIMDRLFDLVFESGIGEI